MKPSCAIFVDVQNIYYTTRQAHNAHFDYRKLWALISAENTIVTANAYAIDRGDERQRSFQSTLKSIGFAVKLKPFI
ncbi:MAG: NYN domain-containing protein, partial [Cellvibrionales bacterium]|nr:NYN domain-containing protein [Cellvibrionales bacterium]